MRTIAIFCIAATALAMPTRGIAEIEAPEIDKFVHGNNEFAINLYHELKTDEGNLFFSPYSISAALGMTYEGARNATATEMREALEFRVSDSALPKAFAHLDSNLAQKKSQGGYELSVANSLWGQEGYKFLDSFLKTLKQYYGAGLHKTDFKSDTEGSRNKINAWVEEKTNNRIQDLIAPGVLTPLTRLVLCNAIYFKGEWSEKFDQDKTKDQTFYCTDGSEPKVPIMHKKLKCMYTQDDKVQAINLPYKGDDISMLVILPKEKGALSEIESDLSNQQIKSLISKMREKEVRVQLPRFKLTSKFSLAETLGKMGMPLAFSKKADFSGMTGSRDLFIGAVVHKAFVEVNEEGTEAAAATGVMMKLTSLPAEPPVFRADHPFIFILRDERTGSILFIGRVSQP